MDLSLEAPGDVNFTWQQFRKLVSGLRKALVQSHPGMLSMRKHYRELIECVTTVREIPEKTKKVNVLPFSHARAPGSLLTFENTLEVVVSLITVIPKNPINIARLSGAMQYSPSDIKQPFGALWYLLYAMQRVFTVGYGGETADATTLRLKECFFPTFYVVDGLHDWSLCVDASYDGPPMLTKRPKHIYKRYLRPFDTTRQAREANALTDDVTFVDLVWYPPQTWLKMRLFLSTKSVVGAHWVEDFAYNLQLVVAEAEYAVEQDTGATASIEIESAFRYCILPDVGYHAALMLFRPLLAGYLADRVVADIEVACRALLPRESTARRANHFYAVFIPAPDLPEEPSPTEKWNHAFASLFMYWVDYCRTLARPLIVDDDFIALLELHCGWRRDVAPYLLEQPSISPEIRYTALSPYFTRIERGPLSSVWLFVPTRKPRTTDFAGDKNVPLPLHEAPPEFVRVKRAREDDTNEDTRKRPRVMESSTSSLCAHCGKPEPLFRDVMARFCSPLCQSHHYDMTSFHI